jgi:hypothetical protein
MDTGRSLEALITLEWQFSLLLAAIAAFSSFWDSLSLSAEKQHCLKTDGLWRLYVRYDRE